MTDDIVTRLREMWGDDDRCIWCRQNMYDMNGQHHVVCDLMEAADEIERLRTIIQDIANAVTDEGRKPGYHKQQVNYVRTMWNPLWQAIGKAVKEVRSD